MLLRGMSAQGAERYIFGSQERSVSGAREEHVARGESGWRKGGPITIQPIDPNRKSVEPWPNGRRQRSAKRVSKVMALKCEKPVALST